MTGDVILFVVLIVVQLLGRVHLFVTLWTAGMLRYVSFMPTLLGGVFFLSKILNFVKKAFPASIEMIIWLSFFNLLMWCVTLVYLPIPKFLASLG